MSASGSAVSEGEAQALREQLGLDQPVTVQYMKWMGLILQGNFGMAMEYGRPVADVIGDRMTLTMIISIAAIIFTWAVALPIGIYSAVYRYSFMDYVFTLVGFIGLAIPGFLLALTADWLVARASANLHEYIGVSAEDALGRPVAEFFRGQAIHDLRNRTAMLRGPDAVERAFGVQLTEDPALYDVAVHFSGGAVVLEAAPAATQPGDVSGTVRAMISRLDQCADMAAFYNEGARLVRSLLEYDRVMVYRFAPDGSGEVVAEAAKPGIGRFLGLHYPASDIPQQARVLYTRNLLRLIADVNAVPVPVVPQLDQKGEPLDLSLSILRSVSPIHIEYLKNMGVGASLSISRKSRVVSVPLCAPLAVISSLSGFRASTTEKFPLVPSTQLRS